ncbi:MAG TPA: ATP synthase F1 subunit gamma [Elusimicrobiota bacterium]|nr:ATP synthase F1 subunit gamma [Elusimicrobiota bacterium]
MASLRELRRKVKSVKSTQQITKAMKMVSAARLRRAQGRILSARPFAQKMETLLTDIFSAVAEPGQSGAAVRTVLGHPLLAERKTGPRGLVLITADKGLCGSFNTNLIKRGLEFLRENEGETVELFCVGRKGRDFFRRMKVAVRGEYVNIFNQLSYAHAELIGRDVTDFFVNRPARDVTVIYNEFKSVMQQRPVRSVWLPLTPPVPASVRPAAPDFLYEPARERLLESLFPRALKAQIFRALMESAAAELAARMTAMENATRNAKELIESLTLYANKLRQAAITKEISELVGGAEALQ